MTIPLGLSRHHRKRLYRCAHKQFTYGPDAASVSTLVRCELCGATGKIGTEVANQPAWNMRETIHRSLPERIARRAEDA